jgi:hypothetical protein
LAKKVDGEVGGDRQGINSLKDIALNLAPKGEITHGSETNW